MPTNILMPALSPTMEEGTLAKWLKSEGDEITARRMLRIVEESSTISTRARFPVAREPSGITSTRPARATPHILASRRSVPGAFRHRRDG